MTEKKHLPPPTHYGSVTVSAKAAPLLHVGHPPPPTQYGVMALAVQKKQIARPLPGHPVQAGAPCSCQARGHDAAPPVGTIQRTSHEKQEAFFLKNRSQEIFNKSHAMEVQSGLIGGRLYIRGNYAQGEARINEFGGLVPGHAVLWHDKDNKTVFQKGADLDFSAGMLHSEQSILRELARTIANSNNALPSRVVVIGTKRPCWYCRRVLLAFDRALRAFYPTIKLHFVDRTGDMPDGAIDTLNINDLGADNPYFIRFREKYNSTLAALLAINRFEDETDDIGSLTKAGMRQASAEIGYLT